MSDICVASRFGGLTSAFGSRCRSAARAAADWLCLAAAPTFALMALLTAIRGDGMSDMMCSAAHGAWPLGGMASMYMLMSAFHVPPWLKLLSGD
jgi:hypothetical protein